MTLESMREDIMKDLHENYSTMAQVIRGGTDINIDFPCIVVDFLGPNIPFWRSISLSAGTRESWTMEEPVHVKIYTQEKFQGLDTSRRELQELVDSIEFHLRKELPGILKEHSCSISWYRSFITTTRDSYYNGHRINEAVMRIHVQEPRVQVDEEIDSGPLVEKLDVRIEDEGGTWEIIIED